MQLPTPVTLTVGAEELTLTQLDPVLIDDSAHKLVVARLHPALRPLHLWRGLAYDDIGNWTQEQAEAEIVAQLSDDPQTALQALVFNG